MNIASAVPEKTTKPKNHMPCGIHIGVCSGVGEWLLNIRLSLRAKYAKRVINRAAPATIA